MDGTLLAEFSWTATLLLIVVVVAGILYAQCLKEKRERRKFDAATRKYERKWDQR